MYNLIFVLIIIGRGGGVVRFYFYVGEFWYVLFVFCVVLKGILYFLVLSKLLVNFIVYENSYVIIIDMVLVCFCFFFYKMREFDKSRGF